MYFSLLMFFACSLVHADDSGDSDDEGKFIDLLPKEEKDAFIESVARRLITGVKTKESRYKSDEELSDEALNEHGEYVRQVIQEQSDQLRRRSKIKTDPQEELNVQALDRSSVPIKIQDDDDKDHVDLTLRGHRRKRDEKKIDLDVSKSEFVPVKTVYDDVPAVKDSENVNNLTKENADENSTAEDIQVRGIRTRSRGSRQSETNHPNLRDATLITDFEPEESYEYVTVPNEIHEYISTDNVDNGTPVTFIVQNVTVSSEIPDNVESSHNGFTQSIFESKESVNGDESHFNESIESVIETKRTSISETVITEELTTEQATTSTQNATKTPKVENKFENTTSKQQFLRLNPEKVNLKINSPFHETNDATYINIKLMVTTPENDVTLENPTQDVNNNSRGIFKNDFNLTSEINSTSSIEEVQKPILKSDVGNKVEYSTISEINKNALTSALPNIAKLNTEQLEIYQINDKDKDTEVNNVMDENLKKNVETFDESNTSKLGNSKLSDIKHSDEEEISQKHIINVATAKTDLLGDKSIYVTKEVNSSYEYKIKDNLRSDINNENHINNSIKIEMVPVESNQTLNNIKKSMYEHFETTSENSVKVLSTTEEIKETLIKNDVTVPKYKVYYSQYVQNDTKDINSDINLENSFNNDRDGKAKEKEDLDKSLYENQGANLEEIKKILRHGLMPEETDDQPEVEKPDLLQTKGKINEYLVYEIPADKVPFVHTKPKPKTKPKEQPYYVPVYNYEPNNAYYNAYNRLGPNDEDDNEKVEKNNEEDDNSDENIASKSKESFIARNLQQQDGHRIFQFTSKKHKGQLKAVHNSNYFGLPFVVKRPKVTDVYFNPDEYLDMDYYFERSRKPVFRSRKKRKPKVKTSSLKQKDDTFPDSLEELHPYHSMAKNDVKNHINAVRQMLYRQKLFGYVPDVTSSKPILITTKYHNRNDDDSDSKSFRSENHSDYVILLPGDKHRSDSSNQQDISLDYYFGLHNAENGPASKRHENFLRAGEDDKMNTDSKTINIAYKQNKTMLLDLIGEIKRRQITFKKSNHKNKNARDEKAVWKKNAGSIKDILEISNTKDVFTNLEKLRELNLTLMRRKESDEDVKVYVNVLKDMVKMDNKALKNFDWLGSTVDILGAVKKLKYLTEHNQNPEDIHPSDMELLEYVLYIFKLSKSSIKDSEYEEGTLRGLKKKKRNVLPRNKKRKKKYLSSGLINRVWLYIRHRNATQNKTRPVYSDFLQFLDDLKNSLFDLHYALKHIAMVTEYKNQQWFVNLKSLYLKNTERKEMSVVLLHIFTSRLLELIEESALNGLEDGYLDYVEHHEKEVLRTKEEFVFVLKLLKEIKDLNK